MVQDPNKGIKTMEHCKGCINRSVCPQRFDKDDIARVFDDGLPPKDFIKWLKSKYKKCPCGTCLVKMICSNVCNDYDKYWYMMKYENIIGESK